MRCTKQETQLKLKQGLSFISFFFFKIQIQHVIQLYIPP